MAEMSIQFTAIVTGAIRVVIAKQVDIDAATERVEILVPVSEVKRTRHLASIQRDALEHARKVIDAEIQRIGELGGQS